MPNFLKKDYLFIIIASAVIAVLANTLNHNPLNPDGILYLEASRAYAQSGWHATMTLYPWPFYPLLIAILHHYLPWSAMTIAFWLNNIFITLLILIMVKIWQHWQVQKIIWYWGVALLLCYAQLNQLRLFVIRDPGYWAALFAAFYLLLRYGQTHQWRYAIGWGLLMAIALLFRIEAAVIWLFLPLTLLFQYKQHRVQHWLIANLVLGLTAIALVSGSYLTSHPMLGRLNDLWIYAAHLQIAFHHLFSITLWLNFFKDFVHSFTLIYLILFCYGFYYRLLPTPPQKFIVYGFIALNFLIPLFFYGYSDIVTRRYLMPLCLSLTLWLPFVAFHISQKRTWLCYLMLVILLVQILAGLIEFGPSKAYLIESGEWLKKHAVTTENVYSNSPEVLFYANRSIIQWQNATTPDNIEGLKNEGWKNYNYLAIRINHNDDKRLQQIVSRIALTPVKIFTNKRHDKVMIFYVSH